jgi:hypothetical protein
MSTTVFSPLVRIESVSITSTPAILPLKAGDWATNISKSAVDATASIVLILIAHQI